MGPLFVEGSQVLIADLGTAQKIRKPGGVFHGGGIPGGKHLVERRASGNAAALQPGDFPANLSVLFFHGPEPLLGNQAHLGSDGSQPLVGVVLPVQEPIFRSAGHNAVGLLGALGHQVVNEGADVAGVPGENHGGLPLDFQGGVDAGHQALNGGFLIAGGAVELARAVKTGDALGFQGGQQGGGVHALVFDGIGRAHDLGLLQTGYGPQHPDLHILRHAGGEALDIHFLSIQAAGLDKELVAGFLRETDNLGFDAGAVPGTHTGNGAVVHGAPVQVFPDDPVGFLVGVGQVANRGIVDGSFRAEGEGLHPGISRLQLHFGKINAAPVDPGRGAGFEPAQGKTQGAQTVGKTDAGVHPVRAGGEHVGADDHRGVQIGAGGKNHGFGGVFPAQVGAQAGNGTVFRENFHNLGLFQLQTGLLFQGVLHILLVAPPVRLGPQGVNGRALAPVQHPVLDAAVVRGHAHFPAQGIQLPDQVALSGAADGGVAGHIAHGVQIDGKENGMQSQPGAGQSGFNTGVARADDGNLTFARKIGHGQVSSDVFFSSRGKGLQTTSHRWMGVPRAWNFSS